MHKKITQNLHSVLVETLAEKKTNDLNKIDSVFLVKKISKNKKTLGSSILSDSFPNNKNFKFKSPGNAMELISKAITLAHQLKSSFIGTEHVIWTFIENQPTKNAPNKFDLLKKDPSLIKNLPPNNHPSDSTNFSSELFEQLDGIIENFFSTQENKGDQQSLKSLSLLNQFCHNLTTDTSTPKLIGRKKELKRISNILGRKMKNNPILVGDPGVGKTAIVEGLAQKISKINAPFFLQEKKIYSLDLGSLIAGTTFRGEFENRLKEIIYETKRDPNLIIFIDEIHNLVGAGNAMGSMDAANLLKPALSTGQIQIIGATTHEEYQKNIEKDAALERRFQPIFIEEPSIPETQEILEGIKIFYEKHHHISISKSAISTASILAKRYLHTRHLPDSAIDLIDESASKLRADTANNKLHSNFGQIKKEFDKTIKQKEDFVLSNQYELAIFARKKEQKKNRELQKIKKEIRKYESEKPARLEEDHIHEALAQITNIPKRLLSKENKTIVSQVTSWLRNNLIGQGHVTSEIHQTILRQISGVTSPDRPLGSFLFVGSTGVGKTYTANLLSRAISPTLKKSIIQINMSEFSEKHTVSRLLGAPAGYIGHEESSELITKIKKNPYSVVLFDEVEKADNAILNLLLQILEEGEIIDAKGKKISFRSCLIILTSNIGAQTNKQTPALGFNKTSANPKIQRERNKNKIHSRLQERLAPELLDRLDNILIFNPLSKKNIEEIIRLELKKLTQRMKEKGVYLDFHSSVYHFLTQASYSPNQGARLIRKNIQNFLEPAIAKRILGKNKNEKIKLFIKNGKVNTC